MGEVTDGPLAFLVCLRPPDGFGAGAVLGKGDVLEVEGDELGPPGEAVLLDG